MANTSEGKHIKGCLRLNRKMLSLKKRKAHAANRNALLKMHNVSVTKVVDTTIQLSVLSEGEITCKETGGHCRGQSRLY